VEKPVIQPCLSTTVAESSEVTAKSPEPLSPAIILNGLLQARQFVAKNLAFQKNRAPI
jgi:hypothetical protein